MQFVTVTMLRHPIASAESVREEVFLNCQGQKTLFREPCNCGPVKSEEELTVKFLNQLLAQSEIEARRKDNATTYS